MNSISLNSTNLDSKVDSFIKNFAKAVRLRREQLGVSQEALGIRANLHRTYIGDLEKNGDRNISLKTAVRVATALETTASELIQIAEAGMSFGSELDPS